MDHRVAVLLGPKILIDHPKFRKIFDNWYRL